MRGFIEELRYRNVFRVAIAYVVAGWLIAQVADLIVDAFNWPDTFLQMIIVLLVLGFPIAVLFAWAFELTPDGLKKAKDLPADTPKDPRSGTLLNRLTIITLIIAVAWLGWDKLQHAKDVPVTDAAVVMDKSIAVLPFDDFSPGGDHAWFADGLTEEILNSLARITDLQVASRTSSFNFRGSEDDVPTIAAELGVAHILEGSVRRAGDRLRVTAQLIRATDDKHLWSETFDGGIEDSIDIQENMALDIAKALQTAMDPEELARMVAAGTRSVEAWEIYLHGLALDQQVTEQMEPGRIFEVIALFEKAVAIDPGFADAHLMLADMWEGQINPTSTLFVSSDIPQTERWARYETAINAAIEHARSEVTRLEAEMRAADFNLRILDQIALAHRMAQLQPQRRLGWSWLNYLYMAIGEYDKSREAGLKAWAADAEPGSGDSPIIQSMHRVSLGDALAMVDAALATPNPPPMLIYQSHRALLAAGEIARAAELADRYAHHTSDPEGVIMVRIRQACAEGRVADADELFDAVGLDSNSRWLFLKTLGRDEDARMLLLPLDKPETLYSLSGYLTYLSFEARDYPLLWKTLTEQGINRPPARPMAYRCER